MFLKIVRIVAIRAFGFGSLTLFILGSNSLVQGYKLDTKLRTQGIETTGIATNLERTSTSVATGTSAYTASTCSFTLTFETKEGQTVQSSESCDHQSVQENQEIPALYLPNAANSYDVRLKNDPSFWGFNTLLFVIVLLFIGFIGLSGIFMPVEE